MKSRAMKVLVFAMVMSLAMSTVAFAETTTTAISSSDFTSVLSALQGQISVSTVVEVLTVLAGATVGLAFMWWGVRKLTSSLMAAFKKGKVKM